MNLQDQSINALFELNASILRELRRREVLRSANSPVGDYAEFITTKALGLLRAPTSTKGYNAVNEKGERFQILGRRLLSPQDSRQLAALRGLDSERPFDFLVGVLFDENMRVIKSCVLPVQQVREHSTYVARTNAARFMLSDHMWELPEAMDISAELKLVELAQDMKRPVLTF